MDSPIYNLTATKQLLEFELNHLTTFVNLVHSFHKEKSKDLKESLEDIVSSSSNSSKISAAYLNSLENSKSDKLYNDNFNKELKFYMNKLTDLKERIKNIDNEINEKKASKEKLIKLFDSLEILNEKEKEQQQQEQQQDSELNDSLDSGFPVMEIREELDDEDNILSSSVSPYGSNPISNLTNKNKEVEIQSKDKEDKETTQSEIAKDFKQESKPEKQSALPEEELESDLPPDFVPMMIREELEDDEDDYKIKSSTISQLPVGSKGKISETKIQNPKIEEIADKNDKVEKNSIEPEQQLEEDKDDETVDADEIRQLLEDMGISEPKIKEMTDDVTIEPQPKMKDVEKEPEQQEKEEDIVSTLEDLQKYNNVPSIDPDDLLTLEFIADELNDENDLEEGEDPNFDDYSQWELQEDDNDDDDGNEYDFEEEEDEEEDEDEDEEEDDNEEGVEDISQFKKFSMMVPQKAQNNFWKQIQELRNAKTKESGNSNDSEVNEAVKESITESVLQIKKNVKKDSTRTNKKSVKFSEKVEVKEVENIWNEMNSNLNTDSKISAFKRRMMGLTNNSSTGPLPLPKSSVETTPKDRLSPRFESELKEILEDSNTTTTASITTSTLSDTSKPISVTDDDDAVSQLVFERPFITKTADESNSIKETSNAVRESQQQKTTLINDQAPSAPTQKPELPKLNTAKEKDTSESEEDLAVEKPQKISKFKQNLLDRNKNEALKPPASFQSSVISEAIVKEKNVDNNTNTQNTPIEEKTLTSASKIVENRSMNPTLLFKPFNKNLNSLKPPSSKTRTTKSKGIPIFHPKDPNPDVPYSEDIDYDSIRVDNYDIDEIDETNLDNNLIGEDISENAVEDTITERYSSKNSHVVDDEQVDITTKEKNVKEFPTLYIKETGDDNKPVSKEEDDLEIVDTTLDYKTLQDDMDTMAKAYVLGLYDDDIATEGEIVEKLVDFEKINKIVEEKEKNTLNIPYNDDLEEDNEKEDKSVMTDEIVEKFNISNNTEITENDLEEEDVDFPIVEIDNDQLDYEINPDLLEQNVALDYHRLRRKMIHKFNGSYKQGAKEKEFEPIDEEGNTIKVSRFKAARLDIN